MKGYFLSCAQKINHLIKLSPYNQYKPVLPTIYPNSVYCSNPFCGFAPHTCLPCAACAQYIQSICTHKLTNCSDSTAYSNKQQNKTTKPNTTAYVEHCMLPLYSCQHCIRPPIVATNIVAANIVATVAATTAANHSFL